MRNQGLPESTPCRVIHCSQIPGEICPPMVCVLSSIIQSGLSACGGVRYKFLVGCNTMWRCRTTAQFFVGDGGIRANSVLGRWRRVPHSGSEGACAGRDSWSGCWIAFHSCMGQRVGNCYLEVPFGTTGVDTWCYLGCYLVLPGVLPGVTWVLPGVTWVFFILE